MHFNTRAIAFVFLLGFSLVSQARLNHGALLYDAPPPGSPPVCKPQTSSPGQWASNILTYNQNVNLGPDSTAGLIRRLYPYSGSIDASSCAPGSLIPCSVGYSSADFGPPSVAAYRSAFETAVILAIIDGDATQTGFQDIQTTTNIANTLAQEICADDNVDGVFFDLEPFKGNTSFSSPGFINLYTTIATLFAAPPCKTTTGRHQNGRLFGIFMNPNNVTNWPAVPGILKSQGFLVVAGYDISNQTTQTPYNLYISSLTGKIGTFMDPASKTYHIRYTVAIPAAASDSEFESATDPNSDPTKRQPSLPINRTGINQLGYVSAANGILLQYAKSPNYIGMDLWSWSQQKFDCDAGYLFYPTTPPDTPGDNVLCYLQQSCS